jgi:hypothetical protein
LNDDVIENAIWITGDEPPEIRKRYEGDVCMSIDELCEEMGWTHGPVKFYTKRPGDERVPPVPDHIQGSKVRLLIGEARIIGTALEIPKGSFVANLDKKDLMRLRLITRMKAGRPLSDEECDAIIEEIGPEAALDTIRYAVDGSIIH